MNLCDTFKLLLQILQESSLLDSDFSLGLLEWKKPTEY